MDKEKVINNFYQKNNINLTSINDKWSSDYDKRLIDFDKKIDLWLNHIDEKDVVYFLKILDNFTYLTAGSCQMRCNEILHKVIMETQQHGISIDEVLFVTVESSSGIKSGGDNLRSDLTRRNICEIKNKQIVASCSNYKFSESPQYKAIVFIDDIIGSGITIWGTIKKFMEKIEAEISSPIKLYCTALLLTHKGINHINKNCKRYGYQLNWIIDDEWIQYPAFEKESQEFKIFEPYERIINDCIGEPNKSFFMGFEKARLSVAFYYNTPNNTLSTFWCKTKFNFPPFERKGNEPKHLSIDELKNKKKISDANSYWSKVERYDKLR